MSIRIGRTLLAGVWLALSAQACRAQAIPTSAVPSITTVAQVYGRLGVYLGILQGCLIDVPAKTPASIECSSGLDFVSTLQSDLDEKAEQDWPFVQQSDGRWVFRAVKTPELRPGQRLAIDY